MDINELKRRMDKAAQAYTQFKAPIDNLKCGNVDKTPLILASVTAEIAGKRTISQISSSAPSNETRASQSHAISSEENRLLPNFVNTLKKIKARLEGEYLNFQPSNQY